MVWGPREFIYIVSHCLFTSFSVCSSFVEGEYLVGNCITKEHHADYLTTSLTTLGNPNYGRL